MISSKLAMALATSGMLACGRAVELGSEVRASSQDSTSSATNAEKVTTDLTRILPDLELYAPTVHASEEINLGDLVEGLSYTISLRLKCRPNGPVAIVTMSADCSCIALSAEIVSKDGRASYVLGTQIEDTAIVELSATLNTQGKEGHQRTRVHLAGIGPYDHMVIEFLAHVRPMFLREPTILDLGTVPVGSQRSGIVQITSEVIDRFSLALSEQLPQGVEVSLVPARANPDGQASQWAVEVRIAPVSTREPHLFFPVRLSSNKGLVITPNSVVQLEEATPVLIYVQAHLVDNIYAEPEYLAVGMVDPSKGIELSVTVQSADQEHPLAVSEQDVVVKAQHPYSAVFSQSRVSVKPSIGGQCTEISLSISNIPEDAQGPFRGVVQVRTTRSESETIEIPFFGVFQASGAYLRR